MDLSASLNSLVDAVRAWSGANTWIVQVFVVVFCVLLLNFVQRLVTARLYRQLQRTRTPWDDALVDALRKPLTVLIWIVGIAFAAQIAQQETAAAIFSAVPPLRDVGVIATIAWFLLRLVTNIQQNVVARHEAREARYDPTTVDALSKLLRASILITAALVMLQTLGFSISGVLAFGGIGGIAVGFAAKDLLANFFGGLMVYLDRPFQMGEWIRSPDRSIEGTVEHIGWRLTRIRTFDKRPVYVPNSTFMSIAVENPSRMSHRRIYETVGLRYDDAGRVEAIVADVKDLLMSHPDIDQAQTLMVNFNAFGPSSLDFFVYCFTRTTVWTEYHEVKQDVLFKIQNIIARHGAEIAFPTSTVHVPEGLRLSGDAADERASAVVAPKARSN
ncbi:MAG TPA: mechanosensitive ion channel family protein [Gammaproteobacteria bacterium]|nr:mechanosensitive ion channel family protein [Gammaproteobacteria bacterium]